LWQHKRNNKQIPTDMTLDAFIETYGDLTATHQLMMIDGNLTWITADKKRGKCRKMKRKGKSKYIGVSVKHQGTPKEYWYAVVSGKYVRGSISATEREAAICRDRYVIENDLHYRLNFSDTTIV
jgi:hypothetical protein